MYTAKKLIEIAIAELGYCEKASNSQLDDKTANAGSNNWTKYARDLHNAGYYQANKNGYAWCDVFVDWCFYKLGGSKTKGEYLECQTGLYGAGCEWSAQCYRNAGRFDKNPKPGDQIFFGKSGSEEHTGIVEKVDSSKVYTIEGNSSNKVQHCSYALTNSRIVGYGHPRYDEDEMETVTGTASTGSDADVKSMWEYLLAKIGNAFGVAGLMGNLYAESGLKSNNLQNSYETKLGYTDVAYTQAVDAGSYSNFAKDSAGYGLAQWTYWTRKQGLQEYAQAQKKSIADWRMQLDFLMKEMAESYKSVLTTLESAKTVLEASNAVLCNYERPADMGSTAQQKRASYGQKYYDKFASTDTTASSETGAIDVGAVVKITGAKYYGGQTIPAWVKAKNWVVHSLSGDRVVINKSEDGKQSIMSPVNIKDLSLVSGGSEKWVPAVGDTVNYNGTTHYVSANATNASKCKGGKAKITAIYQLGKSKHPYHLIRVSGSGATVYGWVDENTFTKA